MAKNYTKDNLADLQSKTIFFDANILMYLFWPTTDSYWVNGYSSLFSKLLKQNNKMAADFIVISEFINRAMRIEFDNWRFLNGKEKLYKEFRDSREGKEILSDIYELVNAKILNQFSIIGREYVKADIEKFLAIDCLDFSDKAITSICKDNNFVLLTNDRDFANTDLEVLSLNKAFDLNSRSIRP